MNIFVSPLRHILRSLKPRLRKRREFFPNVCAEVQSLEARTLLNGYTVTPFFDPATGNHEQQLFFNGFHFASLVETPLGSVILRGHPDQYDPNGYGASVFAGPYIGGPGIDSTGGHITSITTTASGIQYLASGSVPSPGGAAGIWSIIATITYDPVNSAVLESQSLSISLSGPLAHDLSLGRISSNFVSQFHTPYGETVNTGDSSKVIFVYGPDSGTAPITYVPAPGSTATFPGDASSSVSIQATGAVNFSDPLIAAIVKPTVFRAIDSTDTGVTLTAGAQWDSNNNNFFSDNLGAEQIVTPGHTSRTLMHFDVQNSFTLHPYDGAYAASTGSGSSTLAFVTQIGNQLLLQSATTATAQITSDTNILVNGTDVATYGNSAITFSSGAFAGQTWTKLDLPGNFTNPQADAVHVAQSGAQIAFTNRLGIASVGTWISPTQLNAFGETVTIANGALDWADGTVWTENHAVEGTRNGSPAVSLTATAGTLTVTDYLTANGKTVHVVDAGPGSVVFVDANFHLALGTRQGTNQATSADYPNDTATFIGDQVRWQDGAIWTRTTSPSNTVTVTDYTNPLGVPVHLVQNGTGALVFVDSLGRLLTGSFIDSTHAIASELPGDIATISPSGVSWQDGTIWTQTGNPPLLISATDLNGSVSRIQLLTPTTLVGLNGPMQGVTGTRQNGKILWSNGAAWNDFELQALNAFFVMGTAPIPPLIDTTSASLPTAQAGVSTGNVVVATFSDSNPNAAATDFTPVVNWGGAVNGTPVVSMVLASRSATSSNWQVVGNATYASAGSYTVGVLVTDNAGHNVQSSRTRFNVIAGSLPPAFSFAGEYAVTTPGNNTRTLASITGNDTQITLNGTAATVVVNPAELLIGGAVAATYQNSAITFGSSGPFANQTWTKLNLPGDFTNPSGALVHVVQNGSAVTFIDRNGNASTGAWLSPSSLSAFGETVTIGSGASAGQLLWDDGTVWNESVHLAGTSNGSVVTITAVPSHVFVTDYLTGSGLAVHTIQTGTRNIVFVDRIGNMALGTFSNPNGGLPQATAPAYPRYTALIVGDTITWTDGNPADTVVWTKTTFPGSAIAVSDYTNQNGVPVHLIQNGTSTFVIVDALGNTSLGHFLSATTGLVDLYPNDMATFSGNQVLWADGVYVWTKTNLPPLLVTLTDANGALSHGKILSSTTLAGLDGPLKGIQGTRFNSTIVWLNGIVWNDFNQDALNAFLLTGAG